MKKIFVFILCLSLLLSVACGSEANNDNNAENAENMISFSEGLFIPCENKKIVIIDGTGPVEMYVVNDDNSVFDDLSIGDRVLVEHGMILETYPGTTQMFSIEKISDGSFEDIPADIVESLEQLGRHIISEEIQTETVEEETVPEEVIPEDEMIYLDSSWEYADYVAISNDGAMLYRAKNNRKNIIIGVDAGHGTTGASGKKIYCHLDKSLKTTGGSTSAGSLQVNAQGVGMTFRDGTPEGIANLKVAIEFMNKLLEEGYDVLMLREEEKVELDLLARTLIANNYADCHISLHYDGDSCDYDKGAFYIAVPDGIKNMSPVDAIWEEDDRLGECLVEGLKSQGRTIYRDGYTKIDLMQTSYSSIPSVDLELGNQCSVVDDENVSNIVEGLLIGVNSYFGF